MTIWVPRIQSNSRVKYVGIVEAIEADIKDRLLKPGDKLPPQRHIAEALDIDLILLSCPTIDKFMHSCISSAESLPAGKQIRFHSFTYCSIVALFPRVKLFNHFLEMTFV